MRYSLYFLLLCIIPNIVYSQGFKYLNINNGLSSNQVFQVEKDSMGFMWFVTHRGIDRFDGWQTAHYKLKNDSIIYEDYPSHTRMLLNNEGEIMVVLQEGKIFQYNRSLDCFKLSFDIKEKIDYRNFLLFFVYLDSNNYLWLGSNYGLFIYDSQNDNIQPVPIFNHECIFSVIENGKGGFFVGSNQHLFEIERDVIGNFIILKEVKLEEKCGKITSLLKVDEKIYAGTELKGMYVFDTDLSWWKNLFPIIPYIVIRSINTLSDNQIVVGTDGSGAYIINTKTDSLISHFDADSNFEYKLTSNSIYDIVVDESDLWITTYADGVNVYNPFEYNISLYKHVYNEPNSLINNQVNTILEDSEGSLWVGTNNGVSCFLGKEKIWKHFLIKEKRKVVVTSLAEDCQKNIWVGTYGMGTFYINKLTGNIINFSKNEQDKFRSINTNYVYSIYADKSCNVWIGGLWGKLTRYNFKDNSYQFYGIEVLGDIKPLNNEMLLIGTPDGFSVLDIVNSQFKQYTDFGKEFRRSMVRNFYVENPERVWLGTDGNGLVEFNPKTESFKRIPKQEDDLNNIYSIVDDKEGNIWITTEKNIFSFNPYDGVFLNVGECHFSYRYNFRPCVAIRRQNNNLMFGTTDGVIEFPGERLFNMNIRAKLIFTDFKLFYRSIKINDKDSILKRAIDETSNLTLNYKQNSFSFSFSAINYNAQKQIVYTHMLENFDNEWHVATDNRTVNYTNISPGDYNFRLRVSNKETKEIIDERNICVKITPPFWKSYYAWVVYILFLLVVLVLVIQYIRNSIEQRYTKEKNQFFINMAHDIRTPVSLIKAPLNDLSESEQLSEKGKISLDIATRNTERLVTMINQLMDFQKADMALLRLVISRHELKRYMHEKVLLYRGGINHKNISLTLDITFQSLYVWFDREKMDKIVDSLLTNAIKYSKMGGDIVIRLSQDQTHWFLFVIDNGIGIPANEQKYICTRFFRARNAISSKETGSGIGLMLANELVRLHHGSISFTSKENIGTEFKLTFMKGKNFFFKRNGFNISVVEEDDDFCDHSIERIDTGYIKQGDKCTSILIVEDNDDMRLFLKNHLSDLYNIMEATDGLAALEIVHKTPPSLIVSDNLMPNLNGDAMCLKLKSSMQTSHIPVILLTALADKKSILEGLNSGVDDYIVKPFDVDILKTRIANVLKSRELLRNNFILTGRICEEAECAFNPLDKEFIEKAIHYIEEKLDVPDLLMNDFYLAMGMSRSTCYNKLKALTGQVPSNFIKIIKLNKAKELLQSGHYSVFEVSIMTGFTDAKYFSTVFKKQFGVSPSKIKND